MIINSIQNNTPKSYPNFKMKIIPNESVKYAILTSRNLMMSSDKVQNRDFVKKFCNSLARILKSKQAEEIFTTLCIGQGNWLAPSYVEEHHINGKSEKVLWLDSVQEKEHKYGHMVYSQEGGNIMRTIIEYAKTIKDVPEQKLNLTDEELAHYAYKELSEDFCDSAWSFVYPEAGNV